MRLITITRFGVQLAEDSLDEILPVPTDSDMELEPHRLKGAALEEYMLAGKILACRVHSMSIPEIAEQLDVREDKVRRLLAIHLARLAPVENLDELRALQLARYEKMLAPQIDKAAVGNKNAARVANALMSGINTITGLNQKKPEKATSNQDDVDIVASAMKIIADAGLGQHAGFADIVDAELVDVPPESPFVVQQLAALEKQREASKQTDDPGSTESE